MSDYRYSITERKGVVCLHVSIDGDAVAETHIPLSDVLASYAAYLSEQEQNRLFTTWKQSVMGQSETVTLEDIFPGISKPLPLPESWKLPKEMRGKHE